MKVDPYELFGLAPDFTMEELKRSFRVMAKYTHPDRPTGSERRFEVTKKCFYFLANECKTRNKFLHI